MANTPLSGGSRIGRYSLIRVLDSDETGYTYRGEYRTDIGQPVSCLVHEYFQEGLARRRGEDVIQYADRKRKSAFADGIAHLTAVHSILKTLGGDPLVRPLDLFEANGTAYLVTDSVSEESFGDLVRVQGPLRDAFVLSFLSMVAPALREMEEHGVVHRRIGPDTLLRRVDGIPVLTRFTQARLLDGPALPDLKERRPTPFMAPEIDEPDCDNRADLYSLAATVFFALTGAPPPLAVTRAESVDPFIAIKPALETATDHAGLQAALLAALALDPDDRPASVSDFLAMLESGSGSKAGAFAWFGGLSPVAKGGIAAALALPVVAGLGWLLFSGGNGEPRPAPATEPDIVARSETVPETPPAMPDAVPSVPDPIDEDALSVPDASDAEREWLAINRNDVALVRDFLVRFPNDPVSDRALERYQALDEAAWTDALEADTDEAYTAYVEIFGLDDGPAGQFVGDAEAILEDREAAAEQRVLAEEAIPLLQALDYAVPDTAAPNDASLINAIGAFEQSIGRARSGELSDTLIDDLETALAERRRLEREALEAERQRLEEETLEAERLAAAAAEAARLAAEATPDPEPVAPAPVIASRPIETRPAPETTQPPVTAARPAPDPRQTPTAAPPQPTPATRSVGEVFRDCPTCPEMVVLPSGQFRMGSRRTEEGRSDDEGPLRSVSISQPFAIGTKEVTVGEFGAFVAATGHSLSSACYTEADAGSGRWTATPGASFASPGFPQTNNHPAVCLRWTDAVAYAEWLSARTGATYRLPTESEWEYSARARTSSTWPWPGGARRVCDFANGADASVEGIRDAWLTHTCSDGVIYTAPVGSYQANAFGVSDMLGNVWEWVEDCYVASLSSTPENGQANVTPGCGNRVIRGGSWASSDLQLRAAERSGDRPGRAYDILGFRVVREP